MGRLVVAFVLLVGLALAYAVAHWVLIEAGREVVVLRTAEADGSWLETRLWIVDDAGVSWLHGDAASHWVRNLESRPIVELVRGRDTHRYRATPVPGPHPRLHELLRSKYGFADRWVRFVGPDKESTTPVRLEMLPSP
jgi:hypothetical protein